MKADIQRAKAALKSGDYTCVLCKEKQLYTSKERGVKPLLAFLQGGTDFTGFSAADKVVGKAAAFLYVLLGVQAVYAPVMSKPAMQVLTRFGVTAFYDEQPEAIRNRQNTGFCPMESAVLEIDAPQDALQVITKTLQKLSQK